MGSSRITLPSSRIPAAVNRNRRSPLRPYDAEREPAFLYAAGDSIEFEAISPDEYAEIEAALQAGTYEYRVKEAM